MKGQNKLFLGGVYKLKDRRCRLISFNNFQVFFDEWWPHINSWGITNLDIKHYYSRAPSKFFIEASELLKVEPLTDIEFKVHRPDLEMWFARSENLYWPKEQLLSLIQCKAFLKKHAVIFPDKNVLDTAEIFLYPFGLKGGHKKGVKISADNGSCFSETELFFKAQKIQAEYVKTERQGVGLFRTGIEKGLPSFYIGNYYDLAGCILYDK